MHFLAFLHLLSRISFWKDYFYWLNRYVTCLQGNGSRRLLHASSQIMRQYSTKTRLGVCSHLPDPRSKLSNNNNNKTHMHAHKSEKKRGGGGWSRDGNQLPSHSPSSQASWLDSNNQMVLLGLSLCYEVAMGWHNIFLPDCLQSCLSPMASLCNYQHSRRSTDKPLPCKQNTACRPYQLPNHTHTVIGLKRSENLSNSIVWAIKI